MLNVTLKPNTERQRNRDILYQQTEKTYLFKSDGHTVADSDTLKHECNMKVFRKLRGLDACSVFYIIP